MRVALYARISTVTKGQDINLQLNELRLYAKSRGWEIAAEYCDLGVSGSKPSRPGLDQLMQAARQRDIQAVLIWKFDRFARSLRHLVNALNEFSQLGVAFISVRDNIDLSTPSGRLMFHIIGAMAEFETALFAERVKAGMKNARAKGVIPGPKPTVLDKELAKTLLSEGVPVREVCKRLGTSIGTLYRQAIN
jgi:DNA invertase Pin-like site-specific DNA recombinase